MKTVKIEVPIARQFMKHYKELSDWERVTEATKAIDEVKAIRKEIFNRPVSNKMKIIDEWLEINSKPITYVYDRPSQLFEENQIDQKVKKAGYGQLRILEP